MRTQVVRIRRIKIAHIPLLLTKIVHILRGGEREGNILGGSFSTVILHSYQPHIKGRETPTRMQENGREDQRSPQKNIPKEMQGAITRSVTFRLCKRGNNKNP